MCMSWLISFVLAYLSCEKRETILVRGDTSFATDLIRCYAVKMIYICINVCQDIVQHGEAQLEFVFLSLY